MAQLLLVEDNAAAAALICQYMKALYSDHQITICATATDAFDWAGKHHIDLFILDIQLPDYRGTELGNISVLCQSIDLRQSSLQQN